MPSAVMIGSHSRPEILGWPSILGGARPTMLGSVELPAFWPTLSIVSALASGYHGVKRHRGSALWGVGWFALGALFPIITPAIALFQGYAKPER